MSENMDFMEYQIPEPDVRLKAFDKLVGTWSVSGPEVNGQVTYEWMEGGYFMLQKVELEQYGQTVKGIEIIGFERKFGEAPSEHIRSRFYDNAGNTLDYTYEIEDDMLIIWGGEKGSPAYYKGKFSEDGNINEGAWIYPDGGGYSSTMTRIK
jgi:hypothetical protein